MRSNAAGLRRAWALVVWAGLLAFFSSSSSSLRAQDAAPGAPSASPAAASVAPPTPTSATAPPAVAANPSAMPLAAAPAPKVVEIIEGHLELDDLIRLRVANLSEWSTSNDPGKLVPYINGLAILGNYPDEIEPARGLLSYHLEITAENRAVWTSLLGAPTGIRHPVTLSVGLEDNAHSSFDTVFGNGNQVLLTVISPWYGVIAAVVTLGTMFLLIWLARTTNLIRESGPSPAAGKLRPYNLGRAQMAFWFFLIYVSYLGIWLITGSLDTITASLLALMGISAGTALSEALIDSGQANADAEKLVDLQAEKNALQQTLPDLQSQMAVAAPQAAVSPDALSARDSLNRQMQDSRTRLAQVNLQIQDLTPSPSSTTSRGFLRDVLSDGAGYSFHRFQIFAWTLLLGIMFVSSVYNDLMMPEFSATLLGLMGISSGTYIGFKFPEQK